MKWDVLVRYLCEETEEKFEYDRLKVQKLLDQRINTLPELADKYEVVVATSEKGFNFIVSPIHGEPIGRLFFTDKDGMIHVHGGSGVFANWHHKPEEGHNISEILGMAEDQILKKLLK